MNIEALKVMPEWIGLFFKIGTPGGALVILLYCLNIGYFPQGITLGDSAYFFVVSVAYAFMFLIFTVSLFSFAKIFAHIVYSFTKRLKSQQIIRINKMLSAICSSMTKDTTAIFSLFGLIIILVNFGKNGTNSLYVVLTAFIISFFVGLLSLNTNKQKSIKSRIEGFQQVSGGDTLKELEENLSGLKKQNYILLTSIFIWPIIFGELSDEFLNGAIGISKLRVNQASVYVDKKYCDIAKYNYPSNHEDDFEEFCKFKDMVVVFHGIGVNTLLASSSTPNKFIPLKSKDVIIQPKITSQLSVPSEKSRVGRIMPPHIDEI